jgi:hypothetical protein
MIDIHKHVIVHRLSNTQITHTSELFFAVLVFFVFFFKLANFVETHTYIGGALETITGMASATTVVTELANELTTNMDIVGAKGLVRLLRQTDTQVFAGWGALPGINDTPILSTLHALSQSLKPLFLFDAQRPKRVKVIMSGAGTSGRLSFFCARTLNKVLLY